MLENCKVTTDDTSSLKSLAETPLMLIRLNNSIPLRMRFISRSTSSMTCWADLQFLETPNSAISCSWCARPRFSGAMLSLAIGFVISEFDNLVEGC